MVDQAFAIHTVRSCVRRIDFFNFPHIKNQSALDAEVESAVAFLDDPSKYVGEILYSSLHGKPVARTSTFRSALAIRKVNQNLRYGLNASADDRRAIVQSLRGVLAEGVPYSLYKLDVRRFFESTSVDYVASTLAGADKSVSLGTRRVINAVLDRHAGGGYSGIPRGLAISSTLAEWVMSGFDRAVEGHDEVFYFRRYVDDITIVTSQREDPSDFRRFLESVLPEGLEFKKSKDSGFSVKRFRSKDARAGKIPDFENFDYLGYEFNVAIDKHRIEPFGRREVWLDVAKGKVSKIKTRIIKAFLGFISDKNFDLLDRRIRHLTSNLSLLDRSRGVRRVVGIHYNYPLVECAKTQALHELDKFLQSALKSSKGRVFRRLVLTSAQRAQLAKHSFYAGAKSRRFFQMGVKSLGQVQKVWKHG
ncbi:MAG TPA: antiviral reverse transcriptase Drt3a [Candidatus Acidoferrales bacterium]|nr:antiviral reverse transcriptase Drt3a [Candidatus Acidoferrales bacterium]